MTQMMTGSRHRGKAEDGTKWLKQWRLRDSGGGWREAAPPDSLSAGAAATKCTHPHPVAPLGTAGTQR